MIKHLAFITGKLTCVILSILVYLMGTMAFAKLNVTGSPWAVIQRKITSQNTTRSHIKEITHNIIRSLTVALRLFCGAGQTDNLFRSGAPVFKRRDM